MSDMACVYEMNMLEENEDIDRDILAGRGLDVLFGLMDGTDKAMALAQRLRMPIYSVQLYLQRLVKAGLVEEKVDSIKSGQIEKAYQLVSDEIEIINRVQDDLSSDAAKRRQMDIAAQHFAVMTKRAIKSAGNETDKPNKIKSYFMKAKKENMLQFREEIEKLFQKYQEMEDLQAEDTYSLFTVFAPYEMEETANGR